MNRIRLLLTEDHETVRQGLRLLIESQPDLEIVGEAGDGQQAVACAAALRPHVVVMDLSMPRLNGLLATRLLKEAHPQIAIVVLTRYGDEGYVKELLAAGATSYVLKQSASGELLRAIRESAQGRTYLDAALADFRPSRRAHPPAGGGPPVSTREAHVLRLMAAGHSNKEIAQDMGIAVKTVEVHKANAMRKLGLRGRVDVVRYAVLNGWLLEP